MKSQVDVKTRTKVAGKSVTKESDKLIIGTVAFAAVAVGVWSFIALASAVGTVGIASLAKGFLVAVGMV